MGVITNNEVVDDDNPFDAEQFLLNSLAQPEYSGIEKWVTLVDRNFSHSETNSSINEAIAHFTEFDFVLAGKQLGWAEIPTLDEGWWYRNGMPAYLIETAEPITRTPSPKDIGNFLNLRIIAIYDCQERYEQLIDHIDFIKPARNVVYDQEAFRTLCEIEKLAARLEFDPRCVINDITAHLQDGLSCEFSQGRFKLRYTGSGALGTYD